MIVSAVQTHPHFGQPERNLERALQLMTPHRADLFVLPELFSSGYFFQSPEEAAEHAEDLADSAVLQGLSEFSRERACTVYAGVPERTVEGVYNSALLIHEGGLRQVYRKIHLFNTEKHCFLPGNRHPRVEKAGARLGPMICFDWVFPEFARTLAMNGAQILLHSSNLVLEWCQRAMVIRSVENRVFTVLCNRIGTEERKGTSLAFTGASEIVHPRGEVLAKAGKDGEEVILAEIDPADADDKMMTATNHLFEDRRPEFYLEAALGSRKES